MKCNSTRLQSNKTLHALVVLTNLFGHSSSFHYTDVIHMYAEDNMTNSNNIPYDQLPFKHSELTFFRYSDIKKAAVGKTGKL